MLKTIERTVSKEYVERTDKNVVVDIFNRRGVHLYTHYSFLNANGEITNLNLNKLNKGYYLIKVTGASYVKFVNFRKL